MTDPPAAPAPAGRPTAVAIAGRLARPFLPLVAAAPILWLTLMPGRTTDVLDATPWCLVCGTRGIADGLLNVALFLPFGWALGANGWRPRHALAAGLLLSVGIEAAQVFLPNRFPGIGDVLYNGAGAAVGALAWSAGSAWLRPAGPRSGRRLWAWGGLGLAALLATPLLLAPTFPAGRWAAHWAPRWEGYDVFQGRVLDVWLDGRPVRPGTVSPRGWIRGRLLEGVAIVVEVEPGPAPQNLAPVFIATRGERLLGLLIGVDDRDLVIRYRTWSDRLLLDRPDFRFPGRPEGWAEGERVELTVAVPGRGVRVASGSAPPRTITIPSARGWSFLIYGKELDRRWGGWLDLAWMTLWAIPLGLWGTGRRALGPAAVWVVALLAVPLASVLLSPGWAGAAGVALGVAAGRALSAGATRALGLAGPDPAAR